MQTLRYHSLVFKGRNQCWQGDPHLTFELGLGLMLFSSKLRIYQAETPRLYIDRILFGFPDRLDIIRMQAVLFDALKTCEEWNLLH